MYLTLIEMGLSFKMRERSMIGVNFEVFSEEEWSPQSQCMHNGTHLLVMDSVVQLMQIQLLGFKGDMMSILHEDTTNGFGFLRGVCGYFKFTIWIWEL